MNLEKIAEQETIIFEESLKFLYGNFTHYEFIYKKQGNIIERKTKSAYLINNKGKNKRIIIENDLLEDLFVFQKKTIENQEKEIIELNNKIINNFFVKILIKLKLLKI